MIKPDNERLVNFRFVVAVAWYLDFMISLFLTGNYWFLRGDEIYEDFIHHQEWFYYIILVQIIAIFSNFFVIVNKEHDQVTEPLEIAKIYITGNLIVDLISVFPYHIYNPDLIFVRLIQASKWYQF